MKKLLRFYVSNTDLYEHRPLYEILLLKAKEMGIDGITIYEGAAGYGPCSNIHLSRVWEFSTKMPVIVEGIDDEGKLRKFLEYVRPIIDATAKGCLVTMQDVDILLYKKTSNP